MKRTAGRSGIGALMRRGGMLSAFGLALVVAGCSGGDSGDGTEMAASPLRIGFSDWPGWVPWEIAIQKGFFEANEVEVDLVWMDYVASMEAFAAGQLDAVSMTNGDALVSGAAAGKPSTGIILNDYSNGNDMVIGGPNVATLADLRGKKIGVEVGFVSHLILMQALQSAGIAESEVELVNIPTNETPQALSTGGVDAISAWQPNSGMALSTVGGSTSLYSSADAPGIIYDLLFVSRESLAAQRAEWLKVVKTWYDVVAYMQDPANKEEMLGILAARVGLTPAEYEPLLAGTYILSLEETLPYFTGDSTLGFQSLAGSSMVVDSFNVANQVYPAAEYAPAYFDPSLTLEVAAEAGVAVP
jgi:NitT/TauT family transport system substrate-binding protein